MTDIAVYWDSRTGSPYIEVAAGDLVGGNDLQTAVILSLFTDRRASKDDVARLGLTDRRGFWGDAFADIEGDLMGSRLWLLKRAKITPETLRLVKDYAAESLAWMVEDGAAKAIDIRVERRDTFSVAMAVTIQRPEGGAGTFNYIWSAV